MLPSFLRNSLRSTSQSILFGRNLMLPSAKAKGTAPAMKLEKPLPPRVGHDPIATSSGLVQGIADPLLSPTRIVLLVPSVIETCVTPGEPGNIVLVSITDGKIGRAHV